MQKIWPYSKFLLVTQEKKLNEEKAPPQPKETYLKTTRSNHERQIFTDRTQIIALTLKEVVATVHTLQTAIVAEVIVTLELFDLRQD